MVKYWALENFKEDVKIPPPKGFNSWTQIPTASKHWVTGLQQTLILPSGPWKSSERYFVS